MSFLDFLFHRSESDKTKPETDNTTSGTDNNRQDCAIAFLPAGSDDQALIQQTEKWLQLFMPDIQLRAVETDKPELSYSIVISTPRHGIITGDLREPARFLSSLPLPPSTYMADEECRPRCAHNEVMPPAECFDIEAPEEQADRFFSWEAADKRRREPLLASRSRLAKPIPSPEEDAELAALEDEKKAFCDKLSALIADFVCHHKVSENEIIHTLISGKILLGNNGLSPLVVNNDLKIILTAYNEMEIPMQPLTKALFFLFLRHADGIRIAEIPDYRSEIEDLYSLIIPNRDDTLSRISIDNLCDPLYNDSLRQQISKIKRLVKAKILNDDTAAQYYISGNRGNRYSIPLDRSLVKLPRALE